DARVPPPNPCSARVHGLPSRIPRDLSRTRLSVGRPSRSQRPMYAIVNIGGVQTRVTPDEVLDVALLQGEPGTQLEFGEILLVGDGDKISVGRPTVKGAKVAAEIVGHLRGEKVKIFKFKRRREYRRRRGYRSELTRIRVTGISL